VLGKLACHKVPIPADVLEDEALPCFGVRASSLEGAFCFLDVSSVNWDDAHD
jgi:hypothetical protein